VKGVSGGERKRTSIGVELITNPHMVFLDEPTTGLDSFTANILVDILLELKNENKTIVCTIHQPTSEMFFKFDRLMLMAEGRIIYFGDAVQAIDYFGKIVHDGIRFKCPEHKNPGDYFMEIMSKESIPV